MGNRKQNITNVYNKATSENYPLAKALLTLIDDEITSLSTDLPESKIITPQMFGAVGDGVTDDTKAFVDMIPEYASNLTIFIPAGTYMVDLIDSRKSGYWTAPLFLYKCNNIKLIFDADAKIIAKNNIPDKIYNYPYPADSWDEKVAVAILAISGCNDIQIYGGEFAGWRPYLDISKVKYLDNQNTGVDEKNIQYAQHGVLIDGGFNIQLSNIKAYDHIGAGLGIGGFAKNVYIQDSNFYDSCYHGAFVEGAYDVLFERSCFWGIEKPDAEYNTITEDEYSFVASYYCGLDIEGPTLDTPNKNIKCKNCYFGSSGKGVSLSLHKSNGVIISDSKIEKFNINSGLNYLVNNCSITNSITQSSDHPDFKDVTVQNCDIRAKINLSCQTVELPNLQSEWTFKNNTFYFNQEQDNHKMFIAFTKTSYGKCNFDNNIFNIESVKVSDPVWQLSAIDLEKSGTVPEENTLSGSNNIDFYNNTINIGSPNKKVTISTDLCIFSGNLLMQGNIFNVYADDSTARPIIYSNSGCDNSLIYINNIVNNKNLDSSVVALGINQNTINGYTYTTKVKCIGNTFNIDKYSYAIIDNTKDTSNNKIYLGNLFIGNNATRLLNNSDSAANAISTTNTIVNSDDYKHGN